MTQLDQYKSRAEVKAAEVRSDLMRDRCDAKRVQQLERDARAIVTQHLEKAAQAESDDRYAARQHWAQAQASKRKGAREE
ncbi:hypothetical protein ACFQBQ_01495 [Granulicella cerasi]|uniref:Uncharacterized protein n=1 Tax=Granulicella cerasi TaxID=741063 RepID=A0ABW1Z7A7_9BACT|nr:hypothetical protein [Granulicella cerasi]